MNRRRTHTLLLLVVALTASTSTRRLAVAEAFDIEDVQCVQWDEFISSRVNLAASLSYEPLTAKGSAPSRGKRTLQVPRQAAYLQANPFPSIKADPDELFRAHAFAALANVTHRFVYVTPSQTGWSAVWRGWLEPSLCGGAADDGSSSNSSSSNGGGDGGSRKLNQQASAAAADRADAQENSAGGGGGDECVAGLPLHTAPDSLTDAVWEVLWEESFVFASTQHPLTRAVAAYQLLQEGKAGRMLRALGSDVAWGEFCADPTAFARACHACLEVNPPQQCGMCRVDGLLDHVAPQTAAIAGSPGDTGLFTTGAGRRGPTVNADAVVRAEAAEDDAAALCRALRARGVGGGSNALDCEDVPRALQGAAAADSPRDRDKALRALLSQHYAGASVHCLKAVVDYYCWDFVHLGASFVLEDGSRVRVCADYCRKVDARRAQQAQQQRDVAAGGLNARVSRELRR